MTQIYAVFIVGLTAIMLTACAGGSPTPQGQGDSLPPPVFAAHQSISGQICGGMLPSQQSCPAEQYCHHIITDICGAADAHGECRALPQICTKDYRPVCGCDGETYSNECVANSLGVSAASMGACQ